ncbi:MAG: helix-turn-helix domain-containing protein, partial [Actinomadura sp.]
RELRERTGMTSVEATKRLEWSSGRLTKMERGEWERPNPRDMRDLADLYGVTDEREREELITLAKEGRERGWWHPYKKMLSDAYTTYIGLEEGAASVFRFDPSVISGLLQTESYARAVIVGGPAELAEDQIEQRVEVRAKRQELLTREQDALRLWAVLDEAALHRQVGGPDVMRAQLEHLLALSKLAKVTLQIVPFSAGAHAGVSGGFSILQFPEASDSDAVYVENPAGELFVEEDVEVEEFQTAFQRLQAQALSPEATITMIAATVARP